MGYLWRHKARLMLAVAFTLAGNILALLSCRSMPGLQLMRLAPPAMSISPVSLRHLYRNDLLCLINSHLHVSDAGSLGQVSSLITAEMRKELFDH
jgi:hypothetical protein